VAGASAGATPTSSGTAAAAAPGAGTSTNTAPGVQTSTSGSALRYEPCGDLLLEIWQVLSANSSLRACTAPACCQIDKIHAASGTGQAVASSPQGTSASGPTLTAPPSARAANGNVLTAAPTAPGATASPTPSSAAAAAAAGLGAASGAGAAGAAAAGAAPATEPTAPGKPRSASMVPHGNYGQESHIKYHRASSRGELSPCLIDTLSCQNCLIFEPCSRACTATYMCCKAIAMQVLEQRRHLSVAPQPLQPPPRPPLPPR
jgi:hypothetical protein